MTEILEMKQYRAHQIAQAKLYKGNFCDCDGCMKVATDCHELIPRSRTLGNETARRLSFQKELCVQLCREHHEQAHNNRAMYMFMAKNCRIYGYEQVESALSELETAMKSSLNIAFPSREDVNA